MSAAITNNSKNPYENSQLSAQTPAGRFSVLRDFGARCGKLALTIAQIALNILSYPFVLMGLFPETVTAKTVAPAIGKSEVLTAPSPQVSKAAPVPETPVKVENVAAAIVDQDVDFEDSEELSENDDSPEVIQEEPLAISGPSRFSELGEGTAKVFSIAERKEVPVTIMKMILSSGTIMFDVSGCTIKFDWIRQRSEKLYGGDSCGEILSFSPYYGYGNETTRRISKIFVDNIASTANDLYRGAGTVLMQAAMEYGYIHGCEGRIILDACWNSHRFYYDLEMRTDNPYTNKAIAALPKKQQGVKLKFRDFGGHIMFMPKEGRDAWKEKIRANPIFPQTLQYLD